MSVERTEWVRRYRIFTVQKALREMEGTAMADRARLAAGQSQPAIHLFSRVLSEIQEEMPLAIQISGHPPVRVMQVCRPCRNLIMNMSWLWS